MKNWLLARRQSQELRRGFSQPEIAMPRGSRDGRIFKKLETRITYRGTKRIEKQVEVWYARVRFTDAQGHEREKKRAASNYAGACEAKRAIVQEIKDDLAAPAPHEIKHTFLELADHYSEKYVIPPVYVGTKKVRGLRSYKSVALYVKTLRDFFASDFLSDITHERIEAFKIARLNAPVVHKKKSGYINRSN